MDTGTTGYGRKYTSTKHDDELSRVDWREFERMMARWYASRGYDVDHRGTASSGRRTDGGIDLVLTGHGEKVLVQCKHAKVLQVPYTEAMQLFGLVHAEKADRAILITTGEFTREALRKARKVGQLEMIDGKELRRRLGPDIAWLRDGAADPVPTPQPPQAPPTADAAFDAPPLAPAALVPQAPAFSAPPRQPGAKDTSARDWPEMPRVAARRMSPHLSRGVMAACVLASVAAIGYLGVRSNGTPPPETVAAPMAPMAPADAAAPKPAVARTVPPRRAPVVHEASANAGAPPRKHHADTAVAAARSTKAADAPPATMSEQVIYKSSDMSDAEYAAWKLRKARREQQVVEEPAQSTGTTTPEETQPTVERPGAESAPVPMRTMQVILRTNRK
jgi:hypothetical protein